MQWILLYFCWYNNNNYFYHYVSIIIVIYLPVMIYDTKQNKCSHVLVKDKTVGRIRKSPEYKFYLSSEVRQLQP